MSDKKEQSEAKNWDQFWLSRWTEGKINFHQEQVEAFLEKFFPKLEPQKIFVPLCGKSKDMLYFLRAGHEVLGIELSSLACESFFRENEIPFTEVVDGEFRVFHGENITIYCGDFFNTGPNFLSGVTWVYDRAALIALPKMLRGKYAEHLRHLLENESKAQVFLITLSYDENFKSGPPFSVDPNEVERLYGGKFQIQKLISETDCTLMNTHQGMREMEVCEHVFLMDRNNC